MRHFLLNILTFFYKKKLVITTFLVNVLQFLSFIVGLRCAVSCRLHVCHVCLSARVFKMRACVCAHVCERVSMCVCAGTLACSTFVFAQT